MTRTRENPKIPIIGVTGPIGSGKSTVAKLFARWGAAVVSGDTIGHRVIADSPRIRARLLIAFGSDIGEHGTIDRALLAQRAFSSPRNVLKLNRIVHPALIRELNREVRVASRHPRIKAVAIDAALLVEWGIGLIHWDFLVGVTAPRVLRLKRLRLRGLRLAQIRQFSQAQLPWPEKRIHCDFVINNDSSLPILRRRTRLCWEKLLSSERGKTRGD